jgi:hypothetical protein
MSTQRLPPGAQIKVTFSQGSHRQKQFMIQFDVRPHCNPELTQPPAEECNRTRLIISLGSGARQVRRADNLTATYESIV